MKIQTNTAANSALGYASINATNTERSIQKLSSGFRINRAADDAAGLAIANKLRADGKSLSQAQKNASQGTAMLQIMDGATQTISTILDRMKELATQANSANIGNQKSGLQGEFSKLSQEIDRIVNTTKYQGSSLIDGTFGVKLDTNAANSTLLAPGTGVYSADVSGLPANATVTFDDSTTAGTIVASYTDASGNVVTQSITTATAGQQTLNFDKIGVKLTLDSTYDNTASTVQGDILTTGASAATFQVSSSGSYGNNDLISVSVGDLRSAALGLSGLDISIADPTAANAAQASLTALDSAIDTVNGALGTIGAAESRFDFASSNVATMLQNTEAAESTIRDADMAYEMTQYTKNNILQQAAQSMLAQANQGQQGILQLLRG